MHPPDSYDPYRPPSPGYGYQPVYGAQYPPPYQPQYPYAYYGPPPKPDNTVKIIAIVVVAVVLVVIVSIVIAGVLVVYLQTLPPSGGGDVDTALGLRATSRGDGTWIIDVISGTKFANDVQMQVIDPGTGDLTVIKWINSLLPGRNDPDAVFNDNNGNSNLDAGDTIVLKSSGGHVKAGYRVQFQYRVEIIGVIKELPP